MASGIEVAGLALAILPLLVNQLDDYVLGIEKIWRLKRYRREFAHYSTLFGAQHAILLNTLEEVLRGIVTSEKAVSELICNPKGEGWKDPVLQDQLRIKLGRSYGPFMGIMTSLFDLLNHLSAKMRIGVSDIKTSPPFEVKTMLKYLLKEAIYKDLLAKIDETNAILKTLIEQPKHQGQTQKLQQLWKYLLPRYKITRKHAEELFKGIVDGIYWNCGCKEHHCVHFQLQSNPLPVMNERSTIAEVSKFRMNFSNTEEVTDSWGWTEVEFERWPMGEVPTAPIIQDFCSSLRVTAAQTETRQMMGVLSCEPDSTTQYAIHTIKSIQPPVPKQSLQRMMSHLSRRERVRIAAGLACGVIQLSGSWLKPRWNSSDIHLAVNNDHRALLDLFFLTWSLSAPVSHEAGSSTARRDILVPLGRALVELSTGKSIGALQLPGSEDIDEEVTRFDTASRLVEAALYESGTNYAEAVHGCFFWSDRGSLCTEDNTFQDRVFDEVVSPLLRDLIHFEGLSF